MNHHLLVHRGMRIPAKHHSVIDAGRLPCMLNGTSATLVANAAFRHLVDRSA